MALLTAHLTEDPVPPSARSGLPIPSEVDALVLSLLSRDPNRRPASARALLALVAETRTRIGARWDDSAAERWWREHMPESLARRALVL